MQFAKLNERLERSERQQAEPAAKLAKISEALERIEHRASAAADVTGSVKPAAQEAKAAPKPAILEDWVLRRVYDGSALIEGRVGVIEVEPGASLPGGGRVEAIRRQDGHWVVITNRGLIVSAR